MCVAWRGQKLASNFFLFSYATTTATNLPPIIGIGYVIIIIGHNHHNFFTVFLPAFLFLDFRWWRSCCCCCWMAKPANAHTTKNELQHKSTVWSRQPSNSTPVELNRSYFFSSSFLLWDHEQFGSMRCLVRHAWRDYCLLLSLSLYIVIILWYIRFVCVCSRNFTFLIEFRFFSFTVGQIGFLMPFLV